MTERTALIRQPSQCRYCGASILWLNRTGSDRFAPPLAAESGTAGYCIQADGSVLYTMMWQKHECTVDAMHAWEVLQAKRANHEAMKKIQEEGVGQMHVIPVHEDTVQASEAERRYQAARAGQEQALAERRQLAWDDALKRPCPRCSASRGVECWNMSPNLKKPKHVIRPHDVRLSENVKKELDGYY